MSELIFTKTGTNILSGNAIDFEVAVTPYNYALQKDTVFLIISIAEEVAKDSGMYSEIKAQKFYPNAMGLVALDVSSIIDAYLQYFTPPANLNRLIEVPQGQVRKFSIKFSLFDNITLLTESTKYISAIKAGAAYQYFNTDITYLFKGAATEQLLLFITDGNDKVNEEDLFFIYFTVMPDSAPQIVAKYTINYLSAGEYGSVTGIIDDTINTTASLSIACLPGGYNQLGLQSKIPAGAVPVDYSISIFGSTVGVEVAYFAPIKFTIDQRNFYDSVQLVYRNSLGGLQPLRLLGQIDIQADYKFQNVSKMPPPSYLLDGNIIGDQAQQYNEENQKFTGETGFITKYQADRLRDFFLSKQRYEVKDGRLIPIILNTKTVKFYTNRDNLFSVQIDWQHAFTNTFYSNTNLPPDACPAINNLQWRQTGTDEIAVFWNLPFGHAYFRISLGFPGEPLQYFTLEGNSGLTKISFTRPASAVGVDVQLTVKGNVICNRYNVAPSYGPDFSVAAQTLIAKKLPVAINDTFTIPGGYITPVTLSGSVLSNDYDPGGLPIEVIAATGATSAGGTYSIDAAGIIAYTPPSSVFSGADTFSYSIREIPAGTPVTATVTINVGTVAATVYAKKIFRNVIAGSLQTTGEVWIAFYSNLSATLGVDVSSLGLTINYNTHTATFVTGQFSSSDVAGTIAGDNYMVMIYSGDLFISDGNQPVTSTATSFSVLAGTGYTVI